MDFPSPHKALNTGLNHDDPGAHTEGSGNSFIMVGVSHDHLPVAFREKVALDADQRRSARIAVQMEFPGCETVVISTCNRTELFLATGPDSMPITEERAETIFRKCLQGAQQLPQESLRFHSGADALHRLCRIASGLESLILGEPQILTQIRNQFQEALTDGTARSLSQRIFAGAMACGKAVRNSTRLAHHGHGVPAVAVDYSLQLIRKPNPVVAILGRSDLAAQLARRLRIRCQPEILTVHRCPGKARAFASHIGAQPRTLADYPEFLAEVDIFLCAATTGLDQPLAPPENLPYLPQVVLDLTVPRQLSSQWASLSHRLTFHDLETLASAAPQSATETQADLFAAAAMAARHARLLLAQLSNTTSPQLQDLLSEKALQGLTSLISRHESGRISTHHLVELAIRLAAQELSSSASSSSATFSADEIR